MPYNVMKKITPPAPKQPVQTFKIAGNTPKKVVQTKVVSSKMC